MTEVLVRDPAGAGFTGNHALDAIDVRTVRPALELDLSIRLVRHHRGRCVACGHRRVLFSIIASPAGVVGAESPRLCAEDAGIGR